MKNNITTILKKNYIYFTSIIIIFICYLFYIDNSSSNIVWMDQIRLLGLIEKYYEHSITFNDLWRSYLEHRILAYNLIFLGNSIFFHLNTLIEIYLGAVFLLLTSLSLTKAYNSSINKINDDFMRNRFIVQFTFIPILLTLFSLNQWENILLSLSMINFVRLFLFIYTFIMLNNMVMKNKLNIIKIIIVMLVNILLVGAGFSPALIGSLVMGLILISFYHQKTEKFINTFSVLIATALSSILFLFIYMYKLYENSNTQPVSEKVRFIIFHLKEALEFLQLSFATSLIGTDVSEKYLSKNAIILLGSIIMAFIAFSIVQYIRKGIYNYTVVPLFLIFYSILIYGLILIGRLESGTSYGMSSRYTTDTQLSLIGVLWIWICIYFKRDGKAKLYTKIIVISLIALILGGQFATDVLEMKISPYRKVAYEKMRSVALNYTESSSEELGIFQSDEQSVIKGMEIMKKYGLNVYHDQKIGNTLETGILDNGWYPKEGDIRWIKPKAKGIFHSGNSGKLTIKGFIPEVYNSIKVTIIINKQVLSQETFNSGTFSVDIEGIPINTNVDMEIHSDKSFVPQKMNINDDSRELSLIINNLEFS